MSSRLDLLALRSSMPSVLFSLLWGFALTSETSVKSSAASAPLPQGNHPPVRVLFPAFRVGWWIRRGRAPHLSATRAASRQDAHRHRQGNARQPRAAPAIPHCDGRSHPTGRMQPARKEAPPASLAIRAHPLRSHRTSTGRPGKTMPDAPCNPSSEPPCGCPARGHWSAPASIGMGNSEKQGSPNRADALIIHCEFGFVSKSWIHTELTPIAASQKVAGGLPKMMFLALLPCTGLQLSACSNSLAIN